MRSAGLLPVLPVSCAPTPAHVPAPSPGKPTPNKFILITGFSIVAMVCMVFVLLYLRWRRHQDSATEEDLKESLMAGGDAPEDRQRDEETTASMSTLLPATQIQLLTKIGEGSYGT